MSTVYRLRTAWRSGGASSTDTLLYSDGEIDRLHRDLVDAHLDIMAKSATGYRLGILYRWMKFRGREDPYEGKKITGILAIEQLIHDEWVPLEVDFTPPAVRIVGPSV